MAWFAGKYTRAAIKNFAVSVWASHEEAAVRILTGDGRTVRGGVLDGANIGGGDGEIVRGGFARGSGEGLEISSGDGGRGGHHAGLDLGEGVPGVRVGGGGAGPGGDLRPGFRRESPRDRNALPAALG